LYEQLRRADAVVCVVSEAYVESVWCAGEIGAARALGSELLPVVVSPDSERHKLLKTIQALDAAKDPDAARNSLLERLSVIDGGGGWGWPDGQSPYPGLRSFELGDHRVFFGRSREITSIAERLRSPERAQQAILAVVGPSGCGKSSLIRAGVLPRIAGEGYWLTTPPIVPGTDPLGNLVRAIAALVVDKNIPLEVGSLRKDIERDGLKAIANDLLLAARVEPKCKLLIVIDQFEELITQTGPEERAQFAATLAPALGGPVQVLASLRPEFLDAVSKDSDLRQLQLRLRQISPLDSDALREVIEQPAKVAGLSFEDDLVTRLIADTGGGEALPLLAFTLEQLAAGVSRGDCLTHRRYDEIGGVHGALQRQADEALDDACTATGMSHEQVIGKLLDLVTFDEQNRPSKRRLVIDETSAMGALEPFLQRRLLSTEEATGNATLITVSHEAFLVNWPPLKKEIDEHVDALRARHMIENAAHDWVDGGREATDLLDGGRLTKAMVDTDADFEPVAAGTGPPTDERPPAVVPRWRRGRTLTTRVDLNDTAQEYLLLSADADRARKTRAKQKRAGVMALLSVFTVVAVVFGVMANIQQGRAEKSEREAIAQQLIAQARVELSKTNNELALQQLLAGRGLTESSTDSSFYPMVVNSAGTFKIIDNPPDSRGGGLLPVQSVAVSADGKLIASGSNDHTLRVWNADSGSVNRAIELPGTGTVFGVAFDPGGTRIAVGSADGVLQVVDAQTGQISAPMSHEGRPVTSVAFGHSGNWVATGDVAGTVRVWDVDRGAEVATMPAVDDRPPGTAQATGSPQVIVRSVAFSPVADVVAAGGTDYAVRLWDASTGTQIAPAWKSEFPVISVAFDSKGERVAVGLFDGTIVLLDGHTLVPLKSTHAFPNTVNSVAFSSDGTRIVSGSGDNSVKVWDASSLAAVGKPFRGHRGGVSSVAFTRDGTRIVSGSFDGSVREWDTVFGLAIPAGQGEAVRAVAFSPDNHTIASGGSDGTVKLWDSRTARFLRRLGDPAAPDDNHRAINGLAFDPNGTRVATASSDGKVTLWDTGGRQPPRELPMAPPPGRAPLSSPRIQSVAFDRNGRWIVAGGFDGLVRLWDATTGEARPAMSTQTTDAAGRSVPYQVWSVAFSPDGHHVVTGSGFDPDGKAHNLVQMWNVDTLTAEGDPFKGPNEATIHTVRFDFNKTDVVAGSSDGTVRVWDPANRTVIKEQLTADQNPVLSLAIANKSHWIATGDSGGSVRVWDMVHLPPDPIPLNGHQNWVHSVAISPDDQVIVSGSADGTLQLWPGLGDVQSIVCRKLTANVSRAQWTQWVGQKIAYLKGCPDLDPAPDLGDQLTG
jgi:WD40 repeat protein